MALFDARRYHGTDNHPTHGPMLEDLERLLTGGAPGARTLWVIPGAGNPRADGSILAPFNRTSAARAGVQGADPLKQAADHARARMAPTNREEEMAGVVYRVRGGEYPQSDIEWPGFSSQTILVDGPARFGEVGLAGTTTWRFEASPIAFGAPQFPILSIGQAVAAGSVLVYSNLVLSNGSSGQIVGLKSVEVSWEDILEDALTGLSLVSIEGGTLENINVPSALLFYNNRGGSFVNGDITVGRFQHGHMLKCKGDVVVSATPFPPDNAGLVGCRLDGNWTGPAGTARFDKFTQDNHAGAFAGGASAADFLEA
jgi:hypothetical protein